MSKKVISIVIQILPVLLMIGLVPVIANDYLLTLVYIGIIILAFTWQRQKNEIKIFTFGFFVMITSESIFVSTGVEVFMRDSLFGLMPLWLPFLWGYGFVVISRGIKIIER